MNNPIMVKFHATEHFVNIRTVTRQRKSPYSFDLPRSAFIDLESSGGIVVKDGYSFADIRLIKDCSLVRFGFTWLHKYGDDAVNGFAQTVTLNYDELTHHVTDSLRTDGPNGWSMLSIGNPEKFPRLDFGAPGTQRTIRNVLAVPVLRHKLTRVLRDGFKWSHPTDDHDLPRIEKTFRELKQASPREDLTAHVVFTEDSFARPYSLLSRTYSVSSDNKGFWPNMFSNSVFAYCLDKTSDQGVRLDWYMADEGNADGWKVQDCYILERTGDVAAIPGTERAEQGDGTVRWSFGDTRIRTHEAREDGRIRLEPVAGDQATCGGWAELPIDRLYGYCTLLERFINRK